VYWHLFMKASSCASMRCNILSICPGSSFCVYQT
jgi:hypothetical protein